MQQKCDLERHVDNLESNIKLMEDAQIENEHLRAQNLDLSRKVGFKLCVIFSTELML